MSSNAQVRSEGLDETSGTTSKDLRAPQPSGSNEDQVAGVVGDNRQEKEGKSRKRDFFKFGKKADEDKKGKTVHSSSPVNTIDDSGTAAGMRPVSPLANASLHRSAGSPPIPSYGSPASPGRQRLQSASPRPLTPSTSQIFERSVQEDVPVQASPQIPSHIITENHIPPALDASSEAITNSKLDPDTVEIVTHANHQPAAAAIAVATDPSMASSILDDHIAHISRHDADNVSNYGSLDIGDVRRLSFISFADVVHAEQEQEEQRRDSTTVQSLSGHPALAAPRSASPIRSPGSSQALGTSPPTGVKGSEALPTRGIRGPGSPIPGQSSPLATNELNIETMRQALRRTGSGDLSILRSGSVHTVGADN